MPESIAAIGSKKGRDDNMHRETSGRPIEPSDLSVRDIVASKSPYELVFSGNHKGLLRLKRWVEQHSALNLTLTQAAALACLTPHHFSAAFHRHTGETFKSWRRGVRISWAVHAIEAGQHSITEVLHLAGYHDRRAFERAIKQLTGATPGCIRKSTGELAIVDMATATKNHK